MKNSFEIRGDITVIFLLHKGQLHECLIDTADLEKANSFPNTWYGNFNNKTKSLYARGEINVNGNRKRVYLHRWLTGIEEGFTIDHFNSNTLDNRNSINLRIVTNAQNQQNKKGARSDSSTGIRGIEYRKNKPNPYTVRISVNKKRMVIGSFKDIREAEKAAIEARKKYMPFSKEGVLFCQGL